MKNGQPCQCVPLGDLLLGIESGKSIQTKERLATVHELGVLKVSAVSWGEFRPSEAKAVDSDYKPQEHHAVYAGDVLISRANTVELVGAVVRADRDYPNRLLSDKTLRLVLDEKRCDPNYVVQALRLPNSRAYIEANATGTSDSMRNISQDTIRAVPIPLPSLSEQRRIAASIRARLAPIDVARQGLKRQLGDLGALPSSIVYHSLKDKAAAKHRLGEVLSEVTTGVGTGWADYRVLGATRLGLAPARERPGKNPGRYKPVTPGTVFYNPMRILIGSIAFVDETDEPGITSPDYVVLKGIPGVVDSRWFYYWLRSPFGERCINSLARGAVRERMLFNRLAEGEIELPGFAAQEQATKALAQIKPMRVAVEKQNQELGLMPQKLLAQVFES
jgi:type I restriction enzyme S subunit